MRYHVAFVALAVILGLVATPVAAVEWTGQVVALYPDEQVFTIDSEGTMVDLQLQPKASEDLRTRYGQLKVGDTVRVEVNEEELLAMAIEVLPATIPSSPTGEPGVVEPMEPKPETGKDGY